jgi:putative hydrolase of the HAD superfamily
MNKNRRYKAIVFDLFGTLVGTFSSSAHDVVLANMSNILGIESETFAQLFDYDMRTAREVGEFSTIEENIEDACHQLGIMTKSESVKKAAKYRYDFMERALLPRTDAIRTLNQIKSMGCAIGLISDCSPEVPVLWPRTQLAKVIDVPVFSCEVGMKKPDKKIYQYLCERLKIELKECLYVGDGDSAELEGALDVGMDPVLIRVDGEDEYDRDRPLADTWNGKRITVLQEVLKYL